MQKMTLCLLVWFLVPTLVLTGLGCDPNEETGETEETDPIQESLLDEAGIEEVTQYGAWVPGYWTMTIVADEGEIDVNAVLFDDGTVQGLYGFVRTPNFGQQVDYAPDSYGTWEVDGAKIYFFGGTAQDISGTIVDETHMIGSITDKTGTTAPWTAVKTDELDRILNITGVWMINFTVNGQERFEKLSCSANGLCKVVWEKYPGLYEGVPGQERFYTWHHNGGYDFQLQATDGSLSHDLTGSWNDDWNGWEADGSYTNNNDGSSGDAGGIKMLD